MSGAPERLAFGAALWPDRYRACGVVLQPLRIGHAVLLQRLENPLIPGTVERAHGFGDILQAAFVCSRSWSRAGRGVDSWRYRLWMWWKTRSRWWKDEADTGTVLEYLRAQWPSPNYWRDGKAAQGARRRGLDLFAILLNNQRERWGKTFSQAMDTPLALAIWDHLDHAEASGMLRIWTAEDYAAAQRVREMAAKN